MGTQEFGYPQTLGFDYNSDATARIFNGVNFGLTPVGIYSGFTLTKLSNSTLKVSSGICYIQDSASNVGVRVQMGADTEAIAVSSLTPFIVLRFVWVDSQNNFMDVLAVDNASILSDDLIVGRAVYDNAGVTMDTIFDYTRRTNNFLAKIKTESFYLKVTPTEPRSNKVIVSSGVLNSSKGNLLVSGGTFPAAGLANTINGRYDLVYIDENGAVKFELGVDSANPVAPRYGNRKIIAEIRRGASRTDIKGSEIFQVISSFDSTAITSDLLITDANSLYTSSNVEDALQEIAGSNFSFKGDKTFESTTTNAGLLKVAQTLRGAAGVNIQDIKKNDGTLVQYIDQDGKLVNTVRNELAILDQYSVFTTDRVEDAINQIGGGAMTIKGSKTFESPIVSNGIANTGSITNTGTITSTTFNATSSKYKKKEISPFTGNALQIIKDTNIVNYKYINGDDDNHIGFIAEDTRPELSGSLQKNMVISDTIGVMLKAIQELSDKVDKHAI